MKWSKSTGAAQVGAGIQKIKKGQSEAIAEQGGREYDLLKQAKKDIFWTEVSGFAELLPYLLLYGFVIWCICKLIF